MKKLLFVLALLVAGGAGLSQERVTTFGLQMKPIVPSNLFGAGSVELAQNGVQYSVNQRVGYSFGGVLRFGITKWFSLETGISYVRRNFSAMVFHEEFGFRDTADYRIIGYEIPISGLVFVKLSDYIYMNTSFGMALDMFPSDVASGRVEDFYQYSLRREYKNTGSTFAWAKTGLLVNVGFEFRTEKSGYFYFGGSFHRPFTPIYDAYLNYTGNNFNEVGKLPLSGNYLTLDFRYFFHEPPKEKEVKRDPSTMPSWMKNQQ